MSDPLDALAAQHGADSQDALDALAAQHEASSQSGGSLIIPGAALAVDALPAAGRVATAFGQAPNAAKTGSAIARAGTTLSAIAHGFYTGNLSKVIEAPLEGWAAGYGGYWLTKGAQAVASPVGRAVTKAAPVIGVIGDALNAGTIAQAEGEVDRNGRAYLDSLPPPRAGQPGLVDAVRHLMWRHLEPNPALDQQLAQMAPRSSGSPGSFNSAIAAIADRMGRPDVAAKFRGR